MTAKLPIKKIVVECRHVHFDARQYAITVVRGRGDAELVREYLISTKSYVIDFLDEGWLLKLSDADLVIYPIITYVPRKHGAKR